MANSTKNRKPIKNSKRKLTSKGKTFVRRVIAGLLMISALIVAAIPQDKSGIANAATGTYGAAEGLSYDDDYKLARNDKLSMPVTPNLPNLDFLDPSKTDTDGTIFSNKEYYSYEVRTLDGALTLLWKYKYYIPKNGIGNVKGVGVISGYNDTYVVEDLKLTSEIITCYDFVSNADFDAYCSTDMFNESGTSLGCALNNLTFTLDKNPNEDSTAINEIGKKTKLTDVKKYFPEEFENWNNLYESKRKAYKEANDGAEPASLADMGCEKFEVKGSSMSADLKKVYFCDNTNRPGYTLTSVKNLARGSEYLDSDLTTIKSIPNDDTIYITQKYDKAAFVDKIDGKDFKYLQGMTIAAIAKNAFINTKNVYKMEVGESVSYIGDSAFKDSFIESVDFKSVNFIGNEVFKGCQYLTNVKISDKTSVIGREAFSDCKILKEISIPAGVEQIGFGAFSNCAVLEKVDLSQNHGVTIGEYAFYNDTKLTTINFPSDYDVALGKAAFAVGAGTGGACSMTAFTMPNIKDYVSAADNSKYTGYTNAPKTNASGSTYTSRIGDYMFANRNGLDTVTLAPNFGTAGEEVIPYNTFVGCIDLGCLKMDNTGNSFTTYDGDDPDTDDKVEGIFREVQNPKLYVYGPAVCTKMGSDKKYYAYPRRATWTASSQVANYVPYVYYLDGKDHYEVGIDDYRYELEVNDKDGTAKILRCEFIVPEKLIDLIVPGKVADYKITSTESGCFDPLKDYLHSVTVEDDSLENIGDSVFSNCKEMTFVDLGDSVKTIGGSAFNSCPKLADVIIGENIEAIGADVFGNCPKLTDVYFTNPSNISTLKSIGNDAFKTGSELLTIHGIPEKGYAPYDYAMGGNKINKDSVRICYEESSVQEPYTTGSSPDMAFVDSPLNYRMIWDEEADNVILIDYPKYEDLPAELRTAFETGDTLNDTQRQLLDGTKHLVVPKVVESIDIKKYLEDDNNNSNRKNFVYLNKDKEPRLSNDSETGKNWMDVYQNLTDNSSIPGLFSGYIDDTKCIKDGDKEDPTKYDKRGNDWITSLDISGVKKLPDYAFNSCERLQSLIISPDLTEIGKAAFRECDSLTTIGTNGNPKYICENSVLYENLPEGGLMLHTCLPAKENNFVNASKDPLLKDVTKLNEAAFQNCPEVAKIDLSDTKIKTVPNDTFDGCVNLGWLSLPETLNTVSPGAFTNCKDGLDITIPSNCSIQETAFDKKPVQYFVGTYVKENPFTASVEDYNGYKIEVYDLDAKKNQLKVTYLNDDLSIFDVEYTIENEPPLSTAYPDKDPTPKLAQHAGYIFSHWQFEFPDKTNKNVTEDRQAIAVFRAPTTSGNSASGNKPNGNNSSSNNSSNSSNSTSKNSASNNAAKYNVIVENGAGSGSYPVGSVVTITAYSAVATQTFDRWTTSNSDIGFSNAYSISTTFIMPTHDVKVTATYKTGSTSSNSASVNNSNRTTSTAITSNRPTPGDGDGTTSDNNVRDNDRGDRNNGTEVRVTSDTIDNNKKNLASATVAGSTDNFVVKITDSAQASAAIEEALRNKFGENFDNVKYVAFDISLYDETGTYLIENSNDLAVTITLPIPDDLVSYAGNNRVGVAINGELDEKAVKFTTIDGVPCMTFTATHFSPYTIFVDTQNLVKGNMDLTPKTGDGIAPKWFISVALASIAMVLFLWKDKKGNNKKQII